MSGKNFNIYLDHEVRLGFSRHDFSDDDLRSLLETKNFFYDLRKVARGAATIVDGNNFVDCDCDPSVPDGWSVEDHKKSFFMKFDPTKISLFLSKKQKDGIYGYDLNLPLHLSEEYKKERGISGHDLRQELSDKLVMNANLLDYLLEHENFIPKEWSKKNIFFWGTIYRNKDGNLCVKYLCKTSCDWRSGYRCLDEYFASDDYAAIACLS